MQEVSIKKRVPKAKRKFVNPPFASDNVKLREVHAYAIRISPEELNARRAKAGLDKSKLLVP